MAFERRNGVIAEHNTTHILRFYYTIFHRLERERFQIRQNHYYRNAREYPCVCVCVFVLMNEGVYEYMTMAENQGRENVQSPIISI